MKRILFAALTAAALFSGGILQSLNAQNMEIPKKVSPFPVGDKLPEQFSKYFVGQAWLAPLTDDKRLNAPVSNVTFSPGCRNNWHSHTGGQLLIAVGGQGYYQEKGRPARALLPGDIVEIAPDVVHWHGAVPFPGASFFFPLLEILYKDVPDRRGGCRMQHPFRQEAASHLQQSLPAVP